jgi:hypothetical protein
MCCTDSRCRADTQEACFICLNCRGPDLAKVVANDSMTQLFMSQQEQHEWAQQTGLPGFYLWAR